MCWRLLLKQTSTQVFFQIVKVLRTSPLKNICERLLLGNLFQRLSCQSSVKAANISYDLIFMCTWAYAEFRYLT